MTTSSILYTRLRSSGKPWQDDKETPFETVLLSKKHCYVQHLGILQCIHKGIVLFLSFYLSNKNMMNRWNRYSLHGNPCEHQGLKTFTVIYTYVHFELIGKSKQEKYIFLYTTMYVNNSDSVFNTIKITRLSADGLSLTPVKWNVQIQASVLCYFFTNLFLLIS